MMKNNYKYFVILGDVVDSSTQSGVNNALHKSVQQINKQMAESWKTSFEITRGDEVAIVVDKSCAWFKLIKNFNDFVRPFRLRWIVVYGEIQEGLEFQSSAEAVGPAFIKADQLMRQLKKTDLLFEIEIGNTELNKQLRGIINLFLWRINNLSGLQLKILRKYQTSKKQMDVARSLGKSQQQIQRSLKAIGWDTCDLAENAIDSLINDINQKLI